MTITTSSIGAAIDYLVTAVTTAMPTATVFDGPPVTDTQLTFDDRVWIGYSPLDPQLPAAAGGQDPRGLGARRRDEDFAIVCAVEHWSGDTTMQPLRDGAFTLLAAVETLLRGTGGAPGDTTLGGTVLWSGIGGGLEVYQAQTANGASVMIQFHIQCHNVLTAS
jgi:hypothetical protein